MDPASLAFPLFWGLAWGTLAPPAGAAIILFALGGWPPASDRREVAVFLIVSDILGIGAGIYLGAIWYGLLGSAAGVVVFSLAVALPTFLWAVGFKRFFDARRPDTLRLPAPLGP